MQIKTKILQIKVKTLQIKVKMLQSKVKTLYIFIYFHVYSFIFGIFLLKNYSRFHQQIRTLSGIKLLKCVQNLYWISNTMEYKHYVVNYWFK